MDQAETREKVVINGIGYLKLDIWKWISGSGYPEVDIWNWISGSGYLEVDIWKWIFGIGYLEVEYLGQELDKVGGLDQGDESCELGVEGEQVKDGTRLA